MHGFEKRRIVRPLDAHEMDVAAAERDTVGTAGLRSDSACQSLGAKGGFAEEAAQTVQQLRGLLMELLVNNVGDSSAHA